jgi:CRP-like cAMP-binding protein
MPNGLIRRLAGFVRLTPAERDALDLACADVQEFAAGEVIAARGESPQSVFVVIQGMARRYCALRGGHRQILAFLTPGDLCNGDSLQLTRLDYSVSAVTDSHVACVPLAEFVRLAHESPNIATALSCAALVRQSMAREWLVNIGRRPPLHRLAHLICELSLRLRSVGVAWDKGLPLTQAELADALGLSLVHTNRTLKGLREMGLVRPRVLSATDITRLEQFCSFDAAYLGPPAGAAHTALAARAARAAELLPPPPPAPPIPLERAKSDTAWVARVNSRSEPGRAERCRQKAMEAERRAAGGSEEFRAELLDLALQWRDLARHAEALAADQLMAFED